MKVVGFSGYSNSGKTTLIENLIPALKLRGQRVSVIKHAHQGFDIDHQGKDSWRHREAGAFEVLLVSNQRMVLQREFEQQAQLTVHHALADIYNGVDWVLVEGFKESDLLKIEVWREATQREPRYMEDDFIVAIATDQSKLPHETLRPVFDMTNVDYIAQWLMDNEDRFHYREPF
ncbi:MAG: molybdopterin-guanine dinucleotide biosynthesis protein B [Limnohabitans sp.]|nr:molybdopterin-guanine dinucleotide biosynthesis protein B [Limnohabitans sp.]